MIELLQQKQVIVFSYLIAFAILTTGVYLHPTLWGYDSFAFQNAICERAEFPDNTPPGALAFFQAFPCNELFTKFFMLLIILICCIILGGIGAHYYGVIGWYAGLMPFMTIFIPHKFLEFEDDLLAYPFLFFSWWLFAKGRKVEAAILTGIVAWFLWRGAVFSFFGIGMASLPVFLASIPIAYQYWGQILATVWSFTPGSAGELTPIVGLLAPLVLWLGWSKVPKEMIMPFAFFTILAALSAKYAFFLVIPLSLGFMGWLLEKTQAGSKLHIPKYALILIICILANSFIGLSVLPPSNDQLESVKKGIEFSKTYGLPLEHDWDLCYYIEYYEGKCNSTRGGGELPNWEKTTNSIIITRFPAPGEKLWSSGQMNIYRTEALK